jgi:dsRNA-specific ribonuclease
MSGDSNEIFQGLRGEPFRQMITNLLSRGKLKEKYLRLLIDDYGISKYEQAFTSASANSDSNYEIFEQLGDVSANKFIVWYMYRRFPQLNCPLGVKVVARLRINYGARQTFSEIADNLGFWGFISASVEERGHKKKDLLEDCFESFIGVTEFLLDERTRPGVGYSIVYDILSSIFNEIDISLRYEDLYDAKTRLKELLDIHSDLGSLVYQDVRGDKLTVSTLFLVPIGANKQFLGNKQPRKEWVRIGQGTAAKQKDSQQNAAQRGLFYLNSQGYIRQVPEEYKKFCL